MKLISEWLENRQTWNRKRKLNLFMELFQPSPSDKVLDVGPTDEERHRSANILEKEYPYPRNITALGLSSCAQFSRRYPEVNVIQYDGGVFPVDDKAFDLCWCSAVLEHVGDEAQQVRFLKEIQRVAYKVFLTTPNRYFPMELHTRLPFLHYLPKSIFDRVLCVLGKRWASGSYMHLLSRHDLQRLLKISGIENARIRGNRWCGIPVDYNVIIE